MAAHSCPASGASLFATSILPYFPSRISTDFEKFILWLLMRCMELLDDTDELCKVCSIA